jgi:hypothetical protein
MNEADRLIGTQCSYQFCWVCLADYLKILRTDNRAHQQDCGYHTDNLVLVHDDGMTSGGKRRGVRIKMEYDSDS